MERRKVYMLIAGLTLALVAVAGWAFFTSDHPILSAIKREPIMSYTPSGFERTGDTEYEETSVFGGNHDNVGYWYEVTYKREGATDDDLKRAIDEVQARGKAEGFGPDRSVHDSDSVKRLTYRPGCVADLTVGFRGDDKIIVRLEHRYGSLETCY